MVDPAAVPSPPKKKKKLPFKPTALRKKDLPKPTATTTEDGENDEDDGLALFRRRKEMERIVAADQERRRKRKPKEVGQRRSSTVEKSSHDTKPTLAMEEANADHVAKTLHDTDDHVPIKQSPSSRDQSFRYASPASQSKRSTRKCKSELATPPPSKRSRLTSTPPRRISTSPAESHKADSILNASPSTRPSRSRSRPETPVQLPKMESVSPRGKPVISLDDSDDDMIKQATPLASSPPFKRESSVGILNDATPNPPEPPAEEDEFAGYIRRAQEQRDREIAQRASGDADGQKMETTQILITTVVPGFKPVMIKIPFNKPLHNARKAWLVTQKNKGINIPPEEQDGIVLTWRRKKIYSSTTLQILGIRPQGNGQLVSDGWGRGGFDEDRTKVWMEAWTAELFKEMEEEQELQRKRKAGELDDEDEAPEPTPQPETRLRVILKARELDDVKLGVRPETTVETLVTGFRTQRGLTNDRDVSLWFDGERLMEHMTMEDVEIDDMDTIEVHIK